MTKSLEYLLKNDRTIRVIGFDDAPFQRGSGEKVAIAGIICGLTRFEGMLWGEIDLDGWNATEVIYQLLANSKFLPQLHLVLLDGIGFGGFNMIDLPQLHQRLNLPCVSVMRKFPDLVAMKEAMSRLPEVETRWEIVQRAGQIYQKPPFVFQVCGEQPDIIAATLSRLSDRGNVPEALRLAHLIGSAVIKGESGNCA